MGGGSEEPRRQPGYLSYLLRLWQVDTERLGSQAGGTVWRASLESSLTGKRQGFADLDDLFEFLHHQMAAMADTDIDEKRKRRKENVCQENSGHHDG
jgi:hypothetical protein